MDSPRCWLPLSDSQTRKRTNPTSTNCGRTWTSCSERPGSEYVRKKQRASRRNEAVPVALPSAHQAPAAGAFGNYGLLRATRKPLRWLRRVGAHQLR